jgi:NADPH2:quinone reductase
VSFQTAVALADSYSTALIGLVRRGKLKKTDKVLITAAAGGLGLAAVDVAANVYKAKVNMHAHIKWFVLGSGHDL